MRAMTDKAKALGLRPGWYGNNCHCHDRTCCDLKCFEGDVQATLDYGFTSIKLVPTPPPPAHIPLPCPPSTRRTGAGAWRT